MVTAVWNGKVIAESDGCIELEGNYYFPPESVNFNFLEKSSHKTSCPWKGTASYYDIIVEGSRNENAAWAYMNPSKDAMHIKGYIAFWKGVKIRK